MLPTYLGMNSQDISKFPTRIQCMIKNKNYSPTTVEKYCDDDLKRNIANLLYNVRIMKSQLGCTILNLLALLILLFILYFLEARHYSKNIKPDSILSIFSHFQILHTIQFWTFVVLFTTHLWILRPNILYYVFGWQRGNNIHYIKPTSIGTKIIPGNSKKTFILFAVWTNIFAIAVEIAVFLYLLIFLLIIDGGLISWIIIIFQLIAIAIVFYDFLIIQSLKVYIMEWTSLSHHIKNIEHISKDM